MVLASIGTFLTGHIFKEHIQNILAHPEDQPNRHIGSFPIADPNDLPALPGFTPHPDDFADLPGFTPHPDDFAATRDQGGFTPHPEAAGPQILSTPILDRDPRDSILMNENRAQHEQYRIDLAKQQQMSEPGTVIAGTGHRREIDDVNRLKAQYGGETSNWVKKKSTSYTKSNGNKMRTHWYENVDTAKRYEFKTKTEWSE